MRLPSATLALLLCLTSGCFSSFPTRQEVDAFFDGAAQLSPEAREEETRRLFTRLRKMSEQREDEIAFHAVNRFQALFIATQDERLLAGLHDVKLDGGYSVLICILYEQISSQPGFVKFYRQHPERHPRVLRCGLELTETGFQNPK